MDKVGKNPKLKPLVWLFLRWYNEILVFCRAVAVSLDPLFFYVPVIKEDKKCVELNKVLWIIAIVSRSVADFIYLVHSVVKSKILNKSTPAKRRKSLYFWSIFMLNILVILPIPQVRETLATLSVGSYYFHVFSSNLEPTKKGFL